MRALLDLPESLVPMQEFLADRLSAVEARFDEQLGCELPQVAELCQHVERYRGKMLRPSLTLLCGLASAAEPDALVLGPDHVTLAAVVEMVHMATLVHDDVLDEADVRRRGMTVNRLRGNEAAVILGDYLIASSYHLCSQVGSSEASLVVGRASMDMCAGELLQLHNRDEFSIDERTYFEIVRRKTGALIGAACRLGGTASGASVEICDALERFGEGLGVAFQIQDDLLDLTGRERVVGKSVGKDAEKGKLTLPVIHHLAVTTARQRPSTIRLLLALAEGAGPDAGAKLLDALDATNSIAHAREVAAARVEQARSELSHLPASAPRQMLDCLAAAVIDRAY